MKSTNSLPKNLPPSIVDLWQQQVAKTPQVACLSVNDMTLTFAELNHKANQLAHYLIHQGIKPDTFVAIFCDRSVELIISLLAILKSGAAFLPIDPGLPEQRIAQILEDAEPAYLITTDQSQPALPKTAAQVINLDNLQPKIALCAADNPALQIYGDQLAYIIYTSGTTGKPNGVLIEHSGLCHRFQWCTKAFPLQPKQAFLNLFSFSFDAFIASLFWPLLCGNEVVIPSDDQIKSVDLLLDLMLSKQVSTMIVTPSLFDYFLEDERLQLSSLTKIGFGGEAIYPVTLKRLKKIKPVECYNIYGPTECTVFVTFSQLHDDEPITIGKPIDDVQIYVLDAALQPVPIGSEGEIYIGGVGVARGYHRRAQLTQERFLPNPFKPGERIYKTNDIARWRLDGSLDYRGRNDSQVKIRGFRVELGEIQSVLQSLAGVNNGIIVFKDHRLIAYVVSSHSVAEIRKALKEKLPAYMIPVEIIHIERIPLTSNGKVDMRQLPPSQQVEIPIQTDLEKLFFSRIKQLEVPEIFSACQLWEINLADLNKEEATWAMTLLNEQEKNRVQNYKYEQGRYRFSICRAAIKSILSAAMGVTPEKVEMSYSSKGKPYLAVNPLDIHFNLSVSYNKALLLIGQVQPVGIDIEFLKETTDIFQSMDLFLNAKEQQWVLESEPFHRFYKLWTAKEAILKCTGLGITTTSFPDLSTLLSWPIAGTSTLTLDKAFILHTGFRDEYLYTICKIKE